MGLNLFKKKNKCEECNSDLKQLQDLTKRYNELKYIKDNKVGLDYFELLNKLTIFNKEDRWYHINNHMEQEFGIFVSCINEMTISDIYLLIDKLNQIIDYREKTINLNQAIEETTKEINQLKEKLKI